MAELCFEGVPNVGITGRRTERLCTNLKQNLSANSAVECGRGAVQVKGKWERDALPEPASQLTSFGIESLRMNGGAFNIWPVLVHAADQTCHNFHLQHASNRTVRFL